MPSGHPHPHQIAEDSKRKRKLEVATNKSGIHGGVVSAVEHHAADVGAEILAAGGNAADAAVAAAFAQGVVDPLRCGIGGGATAQYFDAKSNAVQILSSQGGAPMTAHSRMFTPVGHWGTLFRVEGQRNQFGYEATLVPGFVRGMGDIFERFGSGRVTWKQILEPSIRLATEGFEVYPHLYEMWQDKGGHDFLDVGKKTINVSEASKKIYLKPDGTYFEIGDVMIQTDLAKTLERIATQGPDEFYTGETGRMIAEDFAANNGYLSASDLASCRSSLEEPITATYRGLDLFTESAPSVGPTLIEILNIVEGWDLVELGWNSPTYLDRFARAIHLAFRDRAAHIGDPKVVDVPLDRLLSKEYAAELRASIEAGTDVSPDAKKGGRMSGPSETTHVTVIDNEGNAMGITHSVGSSSGVVTPGLGFMHNNHMIQFDPNPDSANSIQPGKQANGGTAPVFVFRDDELVLAMGSPAGGRKATAMAQVLVNFEDFKMPIQQAVSVDRIHAEDLPLLVSLEPLFDPRAAVALARNGHRISLETYTARVQAVSRDPKTGALEGGTDPRGDRGLAVA